MATMKKMVAKKAPKKYAMGGSMTTTTETTKKPKSSGFKKTPEDIKLEKKNKGSAFGVIISDEDVRKNPQDFQYLMDSPKYKKMLDPKTNKNYPKSKFGKTISKAKNGTSLGMKSVKAGFDKNPGVTRADIITAATKKAKAGTKVKKAFLGDMLGGGVGKSLLGGAVGGFLGGGGLNKIMGAFKNKGLGKPKNPLADPMVSKSMKKGGAVKKTMKSGGSMKKCKYGCK
jgi:hypothetical protein